VDSPSTKGGGIRDVWKLKGPSTDCDNSCGSLLADHCSKSFVGQLKDRAEKQYISHIPTDQYGATAGRSTDFAHHAVRTLISIADALAYSYVFDFCGPDQSL